MIRHLLHVDFDHQRGLQEQVRESLVNAILGGIFAVDTPLPSCRQLAQQLQVIGQLHGTVYLRGIHRLVPHHYLSPCRDKIGFIPYRG